MQLEYGGWKAEDCFEALPFVCEFGANQNNVTPIGAVSFNITAAAGEEGLTDNGNSTALPETFVTGFTDGASPSTLLPATTESSVESTTEFNNDSESSQMCDEGYTYYNETGFCYKYYTLYKTWYEAEEFCVKHGGHLASMHSSDEERFVSGKMRYRCEEETLS